MIEINFLSSQTRHKQKEKQQDKKLFKIATIVLSAIVFLLMLVVGLRLFVNLRIKNKVETISKLKKTILDQEQIELSYLIFVNKLQVVGEIYSARSDKQEAMNYFADLMSDAATITGMAYNENSGGLILQLNHSNVFPLEDSMAIIDSSLVKDVYKNIEKTALKREDQGNYELSLKIQLKTVEDLGLLNNDENLMNEEELENKLIEEANN
jgi:uncharacterized membrane protein YvbJ